jgi:hypothetical protein
MESGNVADSYTVIVGSVYVVFNTNTVSNITKLKLVFATRIISACKKVRSGMQIYLLLENVSDISLFYYDLYYDRHYIEPWSLAKTGSIIFNVQHLNMCLLRAHKLIANNTNYDHFIFWSDLGDVVSITGGLDTVRNGGQFEMEYEYPDYIYKEVTVGISTPQYILEGNYTVLF